MKINKKSGLLDIALQTPSENFDERPENTPISLIVVHNISLPPGQFGGPHISQLFTNQLDKTEHPYFADIHQLKVSSHLLLRRDGQIIQYVPFHQRAWHAGESVHNGTPQCNDFSIGIELEGTDDIPYETIQYDCLAQIIVELRCCYPNISDDALTGHCDIAPGRKTDPGTIFNWQRLKQLISSITH